MVMEVNESTDTDIDTEAEVNRTLYISSLANQTTEDELKELFLQAGPLEKVFIQSNKNAAFVTFKHSVSTPYAKKLFHDTRLHGQFLSINFRHGSVYFSEQQNGSRSNSQSYGHSSSTARGRRYEPYSHGRQSSSYHSDYQSTSRSSQPAPQDPFTANANVIQGYRTAAANREYVPSFYVNLDAPPAGFMGPTPINQPGHATDFETTRQRLLLQHHYATEANRHRNQRRAERRH